MNSGLAEKLEDEQEYDVIIRKLEQKQHELLRTFTNEKQLIERNNPSEVEQLNMFDTLPG